MFFLLAGGGLLVQVFGCFGDGIFWRLVGVFWRILVVFWCWCFSGSVSGWCFGVSVLLFFGVVFCGVFNLFLRKCSGGALVAVAVWWCFSSGETCHTQECHAKRIVQESQPKLVFLAGIPRLSHIQKRHAKSFS